MIPIVSNCIAMRHMNHTNSIKQMYRKDDGFEKILSEAWTVETKLYSSTVLPFVTRHISLLSTVISTNHVPIAVSV